jgi:hypothetical protein
MEVRLATVTTASRARIPVLSGTLDIPVRTRTDRSRHGRGPSSISDVVILAFAVATIATSRLAPGFGRNSAHLAAIAGTSAVTAAVGFGGVLAFRGDVHVPGTRTLTSFASRVSRALSGTADAYVPLPTGEPGQAGALPVVRQALPNPQQGSTGPNQAGGDAPQVPTEPSATPVVPPAAQRDLPPIPPTARLSSVKHVWQTWNNCGPATVTMALSAIGKAETQPAAAAFLKTSPEDKNVSPNEIVDYVRSRGALSEWRTGGDLMTLKRLVASGIPVIVEVGFEYDPGDWMGHYRLIVGYDDPAGRFIAFDSYQAPGQNVPQPYAAFDTNWRAFNRTFLPVYLPRQAAEVTAIAGSPDDPSLLDRAVARAVEDAEANPTIGFAWFNVGTSLVAVNRHDEAAAAFDAARRLKLPWRMLWYQFAPFEAYLGAGRYADVLSLANINIAQFSQLEESHYYRGRALQALGRHSEARAAYGLALRANGRFIPAYHFLSVLPKP